MKKIVDRLNFYREKITRSAPVMWAAGRKETRYSTSVLLSVIAHAFAFSIYFGTTQFNGNEVLELREITFVDLSRVKPARKGGDTKKRVVTSGGVIEKKDPPPKPADRPQPELAKRKETPPVADRIRTQAPISLARHAPVQWAGKSEQDVLKVSNAMGASHPQPAAALTNPVDLNKKGRLQPAGLTRPAGVVRDTRPALSRLALQRTGSSLPTEPQSGPIPVSSPPPMEEERSPATRKSGAYISGPLSSRGILKKSIPGFPLWAKRKGVGATISFQFTVMEDGTVKENIIVVRTSGSQEWDEEVTSALRHWQFAPLANAGRRDQSGVITFQFVID
jgi:TonB family protein